MILTLQCHLFDHTICNGNSMLYSTLYYQTKSFIIRWPNLLLYEIQRSTIKPNLLLYSQITPKPVTSLRGLSPRYCARAPLSSFRRNVAAVASCWQHCVRLYWLEIWTSDLPLQKRTRYRSTNWPVFFFRYNLPLHRRTRYSSTKCWPVAPITNPLEHCYGGVNKRYYLHH